MARVAKKETPLTPEEKLAQALVPEAEQPYQIPENWQYYKISGIAMRIKRGKAPKYVPESEIPVFAQKCNQKDGTISLEKAQFLNPEMMAKITDDEFLQDKDIIINSTGTGTLGRVGFYKEEFAFPYTKVLPDSHVTVVRTSKIVNQKYLFFFLKSKQDYLEQSGVGTTNQKELHPEVVREMPVPLPPLPEQQRIVDRVESLFAKLDEAKEKAQAVVDGFEDRKASILHKAITGELTNQWRISNDISYSTWTLKRIDQISYPRAGFAFDSKKFTDNGFQIVRMGNLYGGTLDLSRNPVFIRPEDVEENAMTRALINDGDILITLTGTKYKRDYGYAVCIRGKKDLLVNQRILCLSPSDIEVYPMSRTILNFRG